MQPEIQKQKLAVSGSVEQEAGARTIFGVTLRRTKPRAPQDKKIEQENSVVNVRIIMCYVLICVINYTMVYFSIRMNLGQN